MNITKNLLVGRTKEGEKFYVTIQLRDHEGQAQTVTHESLTGYKTLSFTGVLTTKYGSAAYERGWVSCGQNDHYLLEITEPAKGFTLKSIQRLHQLWNELHLNDMNSHCAHQDKAIKWDVVEPCSFTGYKAGTAWLLNPLDEKLVDEVCDLVGREVLAVA